ncbi:winged helix-turn-helix transcriptional regulator [Poritiphilus flavus]|uniref:Transcriptional regulator n=1 Tax=Poritiphilus flavus TaxID=2697053 RepID=A0A6L9EDU1_9FLAO|nr:helix-turn-helix domain-containing protein [Poritiphilus flavus]NAS12885.1 transcriptional regulator [Poritiphilus flavus]
MDEKSEISKKLLPIMDTMELLSGRWKIIIMTTLYLGGRMRFNEIKRSIPRITGRVLSKDLKFLEQHDIVSRTVKDTSPITVEYELTEYGRTLDPVFKELTHWGIKHRKKIIGLG